jgi:hypothetical protein
MRGRKVIENFDVYGFNDGEWHKFQKNVNYEAFFVKRK